MNTFSEELAWREVAAPAIAERCSSQTSSLEPLFPDDERILEKFNISPDVEELYLELTYALREVERFLSNLVVQGGLERGPQSER